MVRPLNALIVSSTKPELVQRVGVDHHLDVVIIGDRQTAVDRGRRRPPILVKLQRAGAALHLLLKRCRQRRIALAGKAEIHRKGVGRLDHPADMPGPRGAGGGVGAGRGTGAAPQHRGYARHQCLFDLLRTDEVDVGIETAGRQNLSLAGDHLGPRPDHDRHIGLNVGIAGLADPGDAAALQTDVGFHDAPMIEDQRIGDHSVDRSLAIGRLALAHAVADDLAAAEFHLLAIGGEVLLHLDDEIGVGEPHAVAGRRTEHIGIDGAGNTNRHLLLLQTGRSRNAGFFIT